MTYAPHYCHVQILFLHVGASFLRQMFVQEGGGPSGGEGWGILWSAMMYASSAHRGLLMLYILQAGGWGLLRVV